MSAREEPQPGGCLCGAVRFTVRSPASPPALCHCKSCRKACGAPAVAWATFHVSNMDFDASLPTYYRSSAGVTRGFCHVCGTPLTYAHDDYPDYVDVTVASLDDPESLPPRDQVWTGHRLTWMENLDDMPEYERTRKES